MKKEKKRLNASNALAWLEEKVPAATKKAEDAQKERLLGRRKQIVFNIIDYEAIVTFMCHKGYILDKNGSFQSNVKDESKKILAGFQLWFKSTSLYDPYGYPHVIKIKTRENGSRMIAIESCIDWFKSKRTKSCFIGLTRKKFAHKAVETYDLLQYLAKEITAAKHNVTYFGTIKDCNLSLQDIALFRKNVNEHSKKASIPLVVNQQNLMASWKCLPYIGHVILQIQEDLLIGKGTDRNLYNMVIAYNNLVMAKKIGATNNVLVCNEDDAFEIMKYIHDFAWTLYDRREHDIADGGLIRQYEERRQMYSEKTLSKKTKQELRAMYNKAPANSLEKAVLCKAIVDRA